MKPKTPKLDVTKLTPEQRDKLDTWKTGQSQLQTLEDIASMAQEMLGIMDDNQKDPGRKTLIIDHVTGDDFVKILQNMQEAILSFKDQKEPTMPDYATPVVEAVGKLEKALAAVKPKDVKPVVNVPAPNVNVSPTPVDFSGVERVLKNDLPKAFKTAIAGIPTVDIPEQDDTAVLDKLTEAITLLGDIDTGVRMKPQPGTMKITNTDGSSINSTIIEGVFSQKNSSTVNLAANGVFTGMGELVRDYASIQVMVYSNQASATDGLSMQQSSDGANWDVTDVYTIAASTGKTFSVQPVANYFRIVYTNGSSAQGAFRLATVYHTVAPKSSSQRAGDAISNENDLEQVSAWLMGYNGATWDRVRLNSSKDLVVSAGSVEVATPFNAIENDVDISVKASAGYLLSVAVSNYNAAKRYFQIHNKATAPAGADVPVFSYPIPAGTANAPGSQVFDEMFFGQGGYSCSTGISIGISTTAATFTAATTTDHVIGGMYV